MRVNETSRSFFFIKVEIISGLTGRKTLHRRTTTTAAAATTTTTTIMEDGEGWVVWNRSDVDVDAGVVRFRSVGRSFGEPPGREMAAALKTIRGKKKKTKHDSSEDESAAR